MGDGSTCWGIQICLDLCQVYDAKQGLTYLSTTWCSHASARSDTEHGFDPRCGSGSGSMTCQHHPASALLQTRCKPKTRLRMWREVNFWSPGTLKRHGLRFSFRRHVPSPPPGPFPPKAARRACWANPAGAPEPHPLSMGWELGFKHKSLSVSQKGMGHFLACQTQVAPQGCAFGPFGRLVMNPFIEKGALEYNCFIHSPNSIQGLVFFWKMIL